MGLTASASSGLLAQAYRPKFISLHFFMDVILAHAHCSHHRDELKASEVCGCFYCLETFPPGEVKEWVDRETTALCPKCGIDAVIGSASTVPLTKVFLNQMHAHWFGISHPVPKTH